MSRPYDIIVWGATGYTGVLVAEYLSRKNLKYAIAGRSQKKLEPIAKKLSCDYFQGESFDLKSLIEITKKCKVIISTVGPFSRYGETLIKACLATETHYIDSTGEFPWVYEMIQKYHAEAQAKKLVLISQCGYDSVPFDMGTYLLHKNYGQLNDVTSEIYKFKGGASGGTMQSIIALFEVTPIRTLLTSKKDYALSPVKGASSKTRPLYNSPNGTMMQSFMEGTNRAIIQRSNGLQNLKWGKELRFNEYIKVPNYFVGILCLALMAVVSLCLLIPPLRYVLKKIALQSGDGPTAEQRENGGLEFSHSTIINGQKKEVICIGKGDPGYKLTGMMLAEAAITVVEEGQNLNGLKEFGGGYLTPSTGLGEAYLPRLARGGLTFTPK